MLTAFQPVGKMQPGEASAAAEIGNVILAAVLLGPRAQRNGADFVISQDL